MLIKTFKENNMGNMKLWFCSACGNEFTGYCPICANCAEVAYEIQLNPILSEEEIFSVDKEIERVENLYKEEDK
jgi:hypothetical protein